MAPDLARRIAYAAIVAGAEMDDDPEVVAERLTSYTPDAAAEECGITWPMRDELLELAYWSGVHRWADRQRRTAAAAAVAAGCPLRVAAEASGLSHQTIANLAS